MRILWRALPGLGLPLVLGLALAYLATGFVPRPAPSLRPPEDLRAQGLGYAEESPVRAILERNVLGLEAAVFDPLGALPRPEAAPAEEPAPAPEAPAALQRIPAAQAPQTGFAPQDPAMPAPGALSATPPLSASPPLSGGPAVQGRIAAPAVPAPAVPAPGQPGQPLQSVQPLQSGHPGEAAPAQPQVPAQALPETKNQRPTQSGQSGQPAHQSGQPARATATAQAQAAPPLTGIRLVGVIAGGQKPLAMLNVDGQAVSLELGATVRGWTLTAVEPGQIVLKSGEHVRRLTLGAGGAAP